MVAVAPACYTSPKWLCWGSFNDKDTGRCCSTCLWVSWVSVPCRADVTCWPVSACSLPEWVCVWWGLVHPVCPEYSQATPVCSLTQPQANQPDSGQVRLLKPPTNHTLYYPHPPMLQSLFHNTKYNTHFYIFHFIVTLTHLFFISHVCCHAFLMREIFHVLKSIIVRKKRSPILQCYMYQYSSFLQTPY